MMHVCIQLDVHIQHTQQQTDTTHHACNTLIVMLCLIILSCKTYT